MSGRGFSNAALDNWITGNHGYDHPANSESAELERCFSCGREYQESELEPQGSALLCSDCLESGERVCEYCGEIRELSEMLAERPNKLRRFAKLEQICERCCTVDSDSLGELSGARAPEFAEFISLRESEMLRRKQAQAKGESE